MSDLDLTARLLALRTKLEECANEAGALDRDSGGDRVMGCFELMLRSLAIQLYAVNPVAVAAMARFHVGVAVEEHARLTANQEQLQREEVRRVN